MPEQRRGALPFAARFFFGGQARSAPASVRESTSSRCRAAGHVVGPQIVAILVVVARLQVGDEPCHPAKSSRRAAWGRTGPARRTGVPVGVSPASAGARDQHAQQRARSAAAPSRGEIAARRPGARDAFVKLRSNSLREFRDGLTSSLPVRAARERARSRCWSRARTQPHGHAGADAASARCRRSSIPRPRAVTSSTSTTA